MTIGVRLPYGSSTLNTEVSKPIYSDHHGATHVLFVKAKSATYLHFEYLAHFKILFYSGFFKSHKIYMKNYSKNLRNYAMFKD